MDMRASGKVPIAAMRHNLVMLARLRSRWKDKLSFELLDCAWHGHVLAGTDAAAVRQKDDVFVRELGGLRGTGVCDATPGCRVRLLPPRPARFLPIRTR